MKIMHSILATPIVFKENQTNILIIENCKFFSTIIDNLYNNFNDANSFVLSENESTISLKDNLDLIISPFSIDMNKKTLVNKLYQKLTELALNEKFYLKTSEEISSLEKFLQLLIGEYNIELSLSEELNIADILKISHIKFGGENSTDILEKVVDYITISHQLLKTKLFVFVNLKTYMGKDDLKKLYDYIYYKKINILLLENICTEKNKSEIYRIIDKNLCEIY